MYIPLPFNEWANIWRICGADGFHSHPTLTHGPRIGLPSSTPSLILSHETYSHRARNGKIVPQLFRCAHCVYLVGFIDLWFSTYRLALENCVQHSCIHAVVSGSVYRFKSVKGELDRKRFGKRESCLPGDVRSSSKEQRKFNQTYFLTVALFYHLTVGRSLFRRHFYTFLDISVFLQHHLVYVCECSGS